MRISWNIQSLAFPSRCILIPIALMLGASACSILPGRPPSPALHDFGSVEKVAAGENTPWSTVTVDAPEWLQSESIRYRLLYADPTHVRFYSQDRWIAPPPSLLAQRLSLGGGGGDWRLKIRLLEFEQVFEGPQSARLIMVFRAIANRSGSEEAAAEKVFRFSRPTPEPDAKGAVSASADLVEKAANELRIWLAGSQTGAELKRN